MAASMMKPMRHSWRQSSDGFDLRQARWMRTLPSMARLNREAIALSSSHGLAATASLRLHRTVPAVEGGATAFRPALGS